MAFNKSDLRVGAPLAYRERTSGWTANPGYHFGWVVERLTPTGKGVAVRQFTNGDGSKREVRRAFQQQGYETEGSQPNGKVLSYGGTFHTDVVACQEVMEGYTRRTNAVALLGKVKAEGGVNPAWGKDTLRAEVERLRALLDAASDAVEAL